MNLHTIPTLTPIIKSEDEDEDEPDGIHCPNCGTSLWNQCQYGGYSESHYIDLDTQREAWDNHDDQAEDSDAWECSNGHIAPDEIAEKLDDF